jgi:hypothetical protein
MVTAREGEAIRVQITTPTIIIAPKPTTVLGSRQETRTWKLILPSSVTTLRWEGK